MNIKRTPSTVAPPFGPYSHAVEVSPNSRLLYISGEVGVLPDGIVPEGIEAQADASWRNIISILEDAGMMLLGHRDLQETARYLQLSAKRLRDVASPLDSLQLASTNKDDPETT